MDDEAGKDERCQHEEAEIARHQVQIGDEENETDLDGNGEETPLSFPGGSIDLEPIGNVATGRRPLRRYVRHKCADSTPHGFTCSQRRWREYIKTTNEFQPCNDKTIQYETFDAGK